ncbi:2-isopropylmalate synthase [Candidatus Aerophobetes bacterium]|nr:2-isopropylmalate synthase [Candidatus Aerophobetes bacterium]
MEKIFIFDTTLRDGEQTPGVAFTPGEKLEIAKALERLGVDVIEAGFPASSPGDFEAVKKVASEIEKCTICALARAVPQDIEKAALALKNARKARIHTFIATSPVHMKYKLRKTPDEVLRAAVDAVKLAREYAEEVEFSPEDASRSETGFLCEIIHATLEAGAKIINIPDTVGYATCEEFSALIKKIKNSVPGIDNAVISVHCHDDLGMAVANSLCAVKAGARQIECAINGIGERAGNAALEEIVMAIRTRQDFFNFYTDINTREIYPTCRLVSYLTGIAIPPNKAIVGKNAFRHQSGIHQDGVLKKAITYEIINPSEVGIEERELVLGKLSGRHAFKKRLESLGFYLGEEEFERCFEAFKKLAEKKKEIFDEDLILIVEEQTTHIPEFFSLEYIHVVTGNCILPTATVRLKKEGKVYQEAACGDGPIDAAYRAIDRICQLDLTLVDYSIKAATVGKDALGEVTVRVKIGENLISGRGSSTDIIEASAKAYINAINRFLYKSLRKEGENVG